MGRAYDRRAVDGFTARSTRKPRQGGFDPTSRTRTPWVRRTLGNVPKQPEHEGA